MDQVKIGKFIAECRRKKNLTQMQLAEKLNITDRAVSKWENGRSMPDSSIMIELCKELKISVNELLSGEVIKMDDYTSKAEENLLEMKKKKEEANDIILKLEIGLMIITTLMYIGLIRGVIFMQVPENISNIMITIATILEIFACFWAIGFEQKVGYFECQKCKYKYVPTYSSVFWAMHMGRMRYMKCPKCGEKSWQKKRV